MLKKLNFKAIFCLFVLVVPLSLSGLKIRAEEQEAAEASKQRTLKIASWNIKHLGKTKAGIRKPKDSKKPNHVTNKTLGKIAEIIKVSEFDLIAIQEYTDHDVEKVVKKALLALLNAEPSKKNWDGIASSNTGGEKYLILYRTDSVTPINPKIMIYEDWNIKMERLPGYCSFETTDKGFDFTIIICHNRTWKKKPEENGAIEDAKYLYDVHEGVQERLRAEDNDIILLGDFNIEDNHAEHFKELMNDSIANAISFRKDTMISTGKKSLDNIFYPCDKDQGLTLKGADVIGSVDSDVMGLIVIDKMISDHYPVWAIFDIPKVDNDAP